MNALTFDVEEWFQVNCLRRYAAGRWDGLESRAEDQTRKVLSILDEYNTKATFFVSGWVSEKKPNISSEIRERGHEIGSHGFKHTMVYEQTKKEFEEDVKQSINAIEKSCGLKPKVFRAPNFSVTRDCLWALDILKKNGFNCDSSIYPYRLVNTRNPDAPQHPYKTENGLWEFPGPTTNMLEIRIPYGGGVFLRTQPYFFTKKAIDRANKKGKPAIVYIHPWELDPHHPKIACSLKARIIHYARLSRTEKILRKLLTDYKFKPIKDTLNL